MDTAPDHHRDRAAYLLGKRPHDITPEERQLGKQSNYLEAYSTGSVALSRTEVANEAEGVAKLRELQLNNAHLRGLNGKLRALLLHIATERAKGRE